MYWSIFLLTTFCMSQGSEPVKPMFFLEQINVLNFDRAEIIIATSLLVQGAAYEEDDLGDALHRIKRLPFVYDCQFSLAKGSRRHAFVLNIDIEATQRLSFGLFGNSRNTLSNDREQTDSSLHLNYRLFSTKYMLAFASAGVQTFEDHVSQFYSIGLNHYDLFQQRLFASLIFAYSPEDGLRPSHQTASLLLSKPLKTNQWFKFSYQWHQNEGGMSELNIDDSVFVLEFPSEISSRIGLKWEYNTMDDALEPTSGRSLAISANFRNVKSNSESELGEDSSQQGWLEIEAEEAWLLANNRSFSIGGGVSYWPYHSNSSGPVSTDILASGNSTDLDRVDMNLRSSLSHSLFKSSLRPKSNELRLTIGASVDYQKRPHYSFYNSNQMIQEGELTQIFAEYSAGVVSGRGSASGGWFGDGAS